MDAKILGGRYQLLEKIGMGGMAIVYKALDDLLNRYVAVKILREEYKDDIKIYVGFEVEYIPEVFDTFINYVSQFPTDYLILGQHFINEEHPSGVYAMTENNNVEDLKAYVSRVVDGIKTGVFSYALRRL